APPGPAHGAGLSPRPVPGAYGWGHGPAWARSAGRGLPGVRAPPPYKRQDGRHPIGRRFPAPLRAHAARMAEATHTVPGEPLYIPADGGWGVHLPTVDDLLSTRLARAEVATLFSARGVTRIEPPATLVARLRAHAALSRRYVA